MSGYHASIAVAFFTRKLAEIAKGTRGQYQPALLLALLWARADPYAKSPGVRMPIDELQGIVSSDSRLRALRGLLVKVGALTWQHGTYVLCKPDVDELDDIARAQLKYAQSLVDAARAQLEDAQRMVGPTTEQLVERAPPQPEVGKDKVAIYLAKIGKQRSDVRDVLAKMADIKPNKLLYSGHAAVPVHVAIAWLTATDSTWSRFVKLCERVAADDSPDKPKRIEFLFEDVPEKRAYLQRMLGPSKAPASASILPTEKASAEKSLEEQQFEALRDYYSDATDDELAVGAKKLDIPDDVLDRYRAQRDLTNAARSGYKK